MDLDRMLEKCKRDQWKLTDLDWSRTPRPLSRADEIAVVQLFLDMGVVERLAGELFREQMRRAEDPRLKEIFRTFVADEARHAATVERLAEYYNVHRYQDYKPNPNAVRFVPYFLEAVRHFSDDVANSYVTGGELILDVALLRSLNDYVADPMSAQAMELINRDESRHIAIDYFMMEYFASPAYGDRLARRPRTAVRERARGAWTFAHMLYHAGPLIRQIFLRPMDLVDPSGKRIREAFKRMQLLSMKPGLTDRPFPRFVRRLQDVANHPLAGPLLGKVVARVAGVEAQYMTRLYTAEEEARSRAMSFDEMAQDALDAKHAA